MRSLPSTWHPRPRYNSFVNALGNLLPALRRESLRPIYLLVGDEIFFRDRFRSALIELLTPPELREYCLFDEDLATTPLEDILARARNASLMAPVQIFFIRNVKELFGRGSGANNGDDAPAGRSSKRKHGNFPANLHAYAHQASPTSILVFIADHVHLPADARRISLEDRSRLTRLEETIGACAEVLRCARVPERQGIQVAAELARERAMEIVPEAAHLLVELLDGDLAMVNQELEKLSLFAQDRGRIERSDVEALVSSSQHRSAFDLARMLSLQDRARCLEALDRIWEEEGNSVAVPLVFQLSRALKMAVILRQHKVQDRSRLYSVLPDGLRPPSFAADDVLQLSQRLSEPVLLRGMELLQRADVLLRSSPVSLRLVMEQVVLELTAPPEARTAWQQQDLTLSH